MLSDVEEDNNLMLTRLTAVAKLVSWVYRTMLSDRHTELNFSPTTF